MSVVVENAIVHIFNQADGYPIFSDIPIPLESEFANYLSTTIEKTFFSDDVKNCAFESPDNIWQHYTEISWDIITISKNIAKEIFFIMQRNKEIPRADLLFGTVYVNNHKYFYMLKLDYRSAPTHFVNTIDGEIAVSIIQHRTLFAVPAAKLNEGFLISVESPSVKVIERKYMIDGIKDFYLSTQILQCTENKTPRQKTNKLLQVAESVADFYYPGSNDVKKNISIAVHEELQNKHTLSVENLGQKIFSQNPSAQDEFFKRLSFIDIPKDEEFSISERLQKKFQKQSIKTSSGVEIKIPTQVYSNKDELEFINNPDGTISLLIKNIQM